MWTDQRMVAEAGGGDGEFFEAFVTDEDGAFKMQPLDPFEIETPYNRFLEYEDGVRVDPYLRPLAFSVRELPSPLMPYSFEWREVAAENMIHVFHRRRAKQFRGLPPAYAVLNDGIDALDTLALEKATAKLHAALGIARIVKAGEKGKGISGNLEKSLGSDGRGTKLEEKFWQGAGMIEMNEGETLELLTSKRPAEPVIDGVKFYCELFSLGHDLPFSVVFSFTGMGGTPTRAETDDAQNVYDLRQEQIIWQHSRPIYIRRLAMAQLNGEIPKCKDPFWWAADWHGPAKSNVDYGRNADADIALVRNGMMSTPRYCEERNRDAFDEADKQIAFLKYVQEQAEANGVPFECVIEPTPGAVTNVNVKSPANE
jgi:capsid protein